MKKLVVVGLVAACAAVASAAWKPGEGIANDHATGGNTRDVTFVARDATNGYGYRQYALPIGLTCLGWSAPNFESSVYGVRFNFGWSKYENTYGLDGGLFSSTRGDFGGIAADFLGTTVSGTAAGIAVGLVNLAESDVYGLQIGAVNVAERLHGIQIGFLNFNNAGIVFPLINIGL